MIFVKTYVILKTAFEYLGGFDMANSENQELEQDDGSSLEKRIEELDKSDPEYNAKREDLIKRLSEHREQVDKLHERTKKQQKQTIETLKILRSEREKHPNDPKIEKLIILAESDAKFLTRAAIETFAHKQKIKNETIPSLTASKTLNTPIDITTTVELALKPLPSEQVEKKKEKAKGVSIEKEKDKDKKAAKQIIRLRKTSPQSRVVPRSNTPNQRY